MTLTLTTISSGTPVPTNPGATNDIFHFVAAPWHNFKVTVTHAAITDGTVRSADGQGVAAQRESLLKTVPASGLAHEFPVVLFSSASTQCSPLRPGTGHAVQDAQAWVLLDQGGNINVFTPANSALKGADWSDTITRAYRTASSQKEIVANLCYHSVASLCDVYKQVLKPLLGAREARASLDNPCGILDALESRRLPLPDKPGELREICNYLRQMESAASYLEKGTKSAIATIEELVNGQWIEAKHASTSLTMARQLITDLETIQAKSRSVCSELNGKQEELREQASARRANANNALAAGGLTLAALPFASSYFPAGLSSWVGQAMPYLSALGVVSLFAAYIRRGRNAASDS